MNRVDDPRLYVDAGHTRIKVAERAHGEWASIKTFSASASHAFLDWAVAQLGDDPAQELVIGSVLPGLNRDLFPAEYRSKVRWVHVVDLPEETLDYRTPETLGIDRYLSCLGAWSRFQTSVVVIDAGTACTVDWMDVSGCYRGGVILPGRDLATRSLESIFPGSVDPDAPLPGGFPGKSTAESLVWGTSGAWIGAVDHFLQRYREMAGAFRLCLTGGDADWVADRLPEIWMADAVRLPWALFDGLQYGTRESLF